MNITRYLSNYDMEKKKVRVSMQKLKMFKKLIPSIIISYENITYSKYYFKRKLYSQNPGITRRNKNIHFHLYLF